MSRFALLLCTNENAFSVDCIRVVAQKYKGIVLVKATAVGALWDNGAEEPNARLNIGLDSTLTLTTKGN